MLFIHENHSSPNTLSLKREKKNSNRFFFYYIKCITSRPYSKMSLVKDGIEFPSGTLDHSFPKFSEFLQYLWNNGPFFVAQGETRFVVSLLFLFGNASLFSVLKNSSNSDPIYEYTLKKKAAFIEQWSGKLLINLQPTFVTARTTGP